MNCPICGARTKVVDTAYLEHPHRKRRTRVCPDRHRFSTQELLSSISFSTLNQIAQDDTVNLSSPQGALDVET